MCLLIELNKDTRFSDTFLRGVYDRNSDGIGVMWADDEYKLHYRKALPSNAEEAIQFFRTVAEGKNCCVHFRMKTHGAIDYENCHPYPVFGFDGEESEHPMLLMHNGVLTSGNSKDRTKSDTWHFVRDVLRPLLDDHPDMIHNQMFQKLLGHEIGNNRFALMDYTGKVAIINRHQGVEYEGSWLSNTYAWDYSGLHPNAPKYKTSYYGSAYDATNGSYIVGKPSTPATTKPGAKHRKQGRGKDGRFTKTGVKSLTGESKDKSGNVVDFKDIFREEVQEFMDNITKSDAAFADQVTFFQVSRLLRETAKIHDAWDLLDMWTWGVITDVEFLDCLRDPRSVTRILAKATAIIAGGALDKTEAAITGS